MREPARKGEPSSNGTPVDRDVGVERVEVGFNRRAEERRDADERPVEPDSGSSAAGCHGRPPPSAFTSHAPTWASVAESAGRRNRPSSRPDKDAPARRRRPGETLPGQARHKLRHHRVRAAGTGPGAARGARLRRASLALLAGSGKGSDTPRPTPGVFGFAPAAFPCPGSRPALPLPRLPPPRRSPDSRSSRVRGACHMIVAPLVARVAAELGLRDWRGHTGAQPSPP